MEDSQPIIIEDGEVYVDPRLKQLSYSSVLSLHSCPRKFQLYRSSAKANDTSETTAGRMKNLTFSFGHMVGTGIQDLLEGKSMEETILNAFFAWDVDILDFNEKQNKSFWIGVQALRRFEVMRRLGKLRDYELVYHEGKPAVELSFAIYLPGGFVYRGFVDAVLRHKHTGKILVLENKTTGSNNVDPATYKNSFQAIGYSIILDILFESYSSYEVLYLIYQTKQGDFIEMPFSKTFMQRARWLSELALTPELIKLYSATGIFPMHGESCFSYYSQCEYYGTCHMSDKYMIPAIPEGFQAKMEKELLEKYQVHVSLEELIDAQVLRAAAVEVEEEKPAFIPGQSEAQNLLDDINFN